VAARNHAHRGTTAGNHHSGEDATTVRITHGPRAADHAQPDERVITKVNSNRHASSAVRHGSRARHLPRSVAVEAFVTPTRRPSRADAEEVGRTQVPFAIRCPYPTLDIIGQRDGRRPALRVDEI